MVLRLSPNRTGRTAEVPLWETRSFGELSIELGEDKAARAVVFGLLGEMDFAVRRTSAACRHYVD